MLELEPAVLLQTPCPGPLSIRTSPTRCPAERQTNRSKPHFLPFPSLHLPVLPLVFPILLIASPPTVSLTLEREIPPTNSVTLSLYPADLSKPHALEPTPLLSFMHFLGEASHPMSSLPNPTKLVQKPPTWFLFPQPLSIS